MTIDELCELVLNLRPNNFMALNGAASGILGSADSGSGALMQLQQATVAFAKALQQDNSEELQATKRDVIAKTMVAVTLEAITEEAADTITETVVALIKES